MKLKNTVTVLKYSVKSFNSRNKQPERTINELGRKSTEIFPSEEKKKKRKNKNKEILQEIMKYYKNNICIIGVQEERKR